MIPKQDQYKEDYTWKFNCVTIEIKDKWGIALKWSKSKRTADFLNEMMEGRRQQNKKFKC